MCRKRRRHCKVPFRILLAVSLLAVSHNLAPGFNPHIYIVAGMNISLIR
ncbi:MAG: hypothetical protein K0S45_333 [Nitrospira sp.]|jgi:hypothetical protein|nr:hypothetical protein [Nitrospira sp.]